MGDMEGAGDKVQLYVYDLSQGFAAQVSQALLGKHIAGVWHTAVVVRGMEYFYGGGVQVALAGSTPYGHPVETVYLGETHVPQEVLEDYITELRQVFTPQAYNLFHNNCNKFSTELSTFLTGQAIPEHITRLPQEVLSTPMGQVLAPMLTGVESRLGSVQQGDAPVDLASLTSSLPAPVEASPAVEAEAHVEQQRSMAAADRPSTSYGAAGLGAEEARRPAQAAHQTEAGPSSRQQAGSGAEHVSAKEAFEAAVKVEFARIMAAGNISANEAALQAIAAARQTLSQA